MRIPTTPDSRSVLSPKSAQTVPSPPAWTPPPQAHPQGGRFLTDLDRAVHPRRLPQLRTGSRPPRQPRLRNMHRPVVMTVAAGCAGIRHEYRPCTVERHAAWKRSATTLLTPGIRTPTVTNPRSGQTGNAMNHPGMYGTGVGGNGCRRDGCRLFVTNTRDPVKGIHCR